ncbi:hypothetical protein [Thalassotalea maritima]|uniref:hypothetical protein n=1 Tax=Thalassotalea maritima TaxID=3242416 RepID=UPI003527BF57
MKKSIIAALGVTLSSFGAFADEHASQATQLLTNDYSKVSYVSMDLDGLDLNGLGLKASSQWDSGLYLNAGYTKASADIMGYELDTYTLSTMLGQQFSISDVSLVEIEAGARLYAVSMAGYDENETFFALASNYKHLVGQRTAVTAGLDYVDGTTSIVTGIEYALGSNFSTSFDYIKNSDETTMMFSIVYRSGR